MKRIVAMTLLIALCISMCACDLGSKITCGECGEKNPGDNFYCKNCGKELDPPSEEADTPGEDIDVKKHVGYWGIKDSYEKQLNINQQISNTVYFSLLYNTGAKLENCAAKLNGNIASFSIADDQAVMKGELEFHSETVTLRITGSTKDGMPAETMEFDRKYSEPFIKTATEFSTGISPEIPSVTTTKGTDPTYILSQSSTRLLTDSDIRHLNASQLKLARNEIYAKHGRKFDDASLQSYFNTKSWYTGSIEPKNFNDSKLNRFERVNVEFIRYWEKNGRGPSWDGDYIFPHSNTKLLTYNDMIGMSSWELKVARNEIYARHGRKFDDEGLKGYFALKPWYSPYIYGADFNTSVLNSIEKKNIEFIQSFEK